MQKYIDKGPELQIRSVIALDHLKNYIYIEADKEAHVKEVCVYDVSLLSVDADWQRQLCSCNCLMIVKLQIKVLVLLQACKGLRNIYAQKVMLVPIREMTDVLSVESKAIDLSRDTWVRMKIGTYKGDLAKV